MKDLVVNVRPTHTATCDGLSRIELLAWVNDSLKAKFTKVDELCTGAAYCQLMHSLFPNKISLKRVKFYTNIENEFFDNFKILQTTFQKLGVQKSIPIERLCRGKFQDNIEFLQWFRKFYEANDTKDKNYDPVAERDGKCIGFGIKLTKQASERRSKVSLPYKNDKSLTSFRSAKLSLGTNINDCAFKRSLTKVQLKKCIQNGHEHEHENEEKQKQNQKEKQVNERERDNENENETENEIENELNIQQNDEKSTESDDATNQKSNETFEIIGDSYLNNSDKKVDIAEEKFNGVSDNNETGVEKHKIISELQDVKEKLAAIQKTRDKFYHKLKKIGNCIKEAEDAGILNVETWKITSILLGDSGEIKD